MARPVARDASPETFAAVRKAFGPPAQRFTPEATPSRPGQQQANRGHFSRFGPVQVFWLL